MYFGKSMSFWKVWLKTDSIAVFAAFFLHRIACCKIDFRHFLENDVFSLVFNTLNLKSSLILSFPGFGSIKKRFLMVESCLEHIPKLILIGKSLANYLYMYVCYVCMLCILCMYSMYVSYACTRSMYSMHVFYVCL